MSRLDELLERDAKRRRPVKRRFELHVCALDPLCRYIDRDVMHRSLTHRIMIGTPWGALHLAYFPDGKLPGPRRLDGTIPWHWVIWDSSPFP